MVLPAHPSQDARVFLFHCDAYDAARIRALVGQAMTALDLRPHGRTLVKPNLVAAGELFAHAYTRPEIVEGVLGALRDRESKDAELGGVQNPYFDKRQIVGFNRSYLSWRGRSAFKRLLGRPYQIHGATPRGAARPVVTPLTTETTGE